VEIVVTNPDYDGPRRRLAVGDSQPFGREVGGVGRLGDDPTISRCHGVVVATEHGFTVEATGTFTGVTVRDRVTPSRLHIPNGVGPVDIPFRNCTISVDSDAGPARLDIEVIGSPRADTWATQWGIDAPPRPPTDRASTRPRSPTSAPARMRDPGLFRKSNGVHYSWFNVLVALCEAALISDDGVAPTNDELAERTGYSVGNIEKKFAEIYRALEINPANTPRPRDIAIHRAITNGIVTPDHLPLLDAGSLAQPQRIRRTARRTQ